MRRALACLALLTLVGCGSAEPTAPEPPTGRNQLLLSLREIPGKPSLSPARALPAFALYGDRRLIAATGHSGALRTAEVRRIDRGRFRELYEKAHAIHGGEDSAEVVDGGTLVLTLGEREIRGPLRAEGELNRFRAELASTAEGSGAASRAQPYRPERILALATGAEPGARAERTWPLGGLAGNCTVVEAAEAERLARGATTETRWAAGKRVVRVDFRPLLPGESGCAAVGEAG